eukprot:10989145-Ditylum_brightwellii.AAC.1
MHPLGTNDFCISGLVIVENFVSATYPSQNTIENNHQDKKSAFAATARTDMPLKYTHVCT